MLNNSAATTKKKKKKQKNDERNDWTGSEKRDSVFICMLSSIQVNATNSRSFIS